MEDVETFEQELTEQLIQKHRYLDLILFRKRREKEDIQLKKKLCSAIGKLKQARESNVEDTIVIDSQTSRERQLIHIAAIAFDFHHGRNMTPKSTSTCIDKRILCQGRCFICRQNQSKQYKCHPTSVWISTHPKNLSKKDIHHQENSTAENIVDFKNLQEIHKAVILELVETFAK